MTVLIPKDTTIPTKKGEIFTTAADNQTQVEIVVFQGERPIAPQNKLLGRFALTRTSAITARALSADRGYVRYRCQRHCECNPKDLGTGKTQAITLTSSTNLSEAEIRNMVRDEQHRQEDKKRKGSRGAPTSRVADLPDGEKSPGAWLEGRSGDQDDVQKELDSAKQALSRATWIIIVALLRNSEARLRKSALRFTNRCSMRKPARRVRQWGSRAGRGLIRAGRGADGGPQWSSGDGASMN